MIPKSRLSGGCGYIWRLSKCARTQEEWDRAKKCKTFRHHVSAIVLKAGDTSITNRLRWVIKQLALRPDFSLISSLRNQVAASLAKIATARSYKLRHRRGHAAAPVRRATGVEPLREPVGEDHREKTQGWTKDDCLPLG